MLESVMQSDRIIIVCVIVVK